jgi:hypothetical protein
MILRARIDCADETRSNQEKKLRSEIAVTWA